MSSIFPNGLGVRKNNLTGSASIAGWATASATIDRINSAEFLTSYSANGPGIVAALADNVWVDVLDKTFAHPVVAQVSVSAWLNHTVSIPIGHALFVRVYIDEVLEQERGTTSAAINTSSSMTNAVYINQLDDVIIARRIRVQAKRIGSSLSESCGISASIRTYDTRGL